MFPGPTWAGAEKPLPVKKNKEQLAFYLSILMIIWWLDSIGGAGVDGGDAVLRNVL